jgi:hypothetical protein
VLLAETAEVVGIGEAEGLAIDSSAQDIAGQYSFTAIGALLMDY